MGTFRNSMPSIMAIHAVLENNNTNIRNNNSNNANYLMFILAAPIRAIQLELNTKTAPLAHLAPEKKRTASMTNQSHMLNVIHADIKLTFKQLLWHYYL